MQPALARPRPKSQPFSLRLTGREREIRLHRHSLRESTWHNPQSDKDAGAASEDADEDANEDANEDVDAEEAAMLLFAQLRAVFSDRRLTRPQAAKLVTKGKWSTVALASAARARRFLAWNGRFSPLGKRFVLAFRSSSQHYTTLIACLPISTENREAFGPNGSMAPYCT